jgi:hydroxyacylglutathione hydrolase
MTDPHIKVKIIPQLKDNYSYVVYSDEKKLAAIVDPAESASIINFIQKKNLAIETIILTHHHYDHTAGVQDILNLSTVPVYSPDIKISGTSQVARNNDRINLSFLSFNVLATPGHTLDHIIFYDGHNKILFSGDTLFRFGCGRVFEGTYEQMKLSLQLLAGLDDAAQVYCGHEYTLSNLDFLQSIFPDNEELKISKQKINTQINTTGSSIPFNLGEEKKLNPFLSSSSSYYQDFMKKNKFNDLAMFSYLRDLKNKF